MRLYTYLHINMSMNIQAGVHTLLVPPPPLRMNTLTLYVLTCKRTRKHVLRSARCLCRRRENLFKLRLYEACQYFEEQSPIAQIKAKKTSNRQK
jgi:hypothetical protein